MSTAVEKINKDSVFKFLEPKQEELITIVGKGSLEQGKALIMKEMSFAIQAANKNPQLRNANPASVAMAVYNVILSGLTLNPMMEMCDLVPYETGSYDEQGNWRGRVEAQLQPRYAGMLKLAADTGAFKDAPFTSCVYKKDVGKKVGCTAGNKAALKRYMTALHMHEQLIEAVRQLVREELGNLKEDEPCWKNYQQIGMKMKDGKQVPNCVPKKKS
jgi:hypothetical protein